MRSCGTVDRAGPLPGADAAGVSLRGRSWQRTGASRGAGHDRRHARSPRPPGSQVALVAGDEANLKITDAGRSRPRRAAARRARWRPRTGLGFDVHRLGPGDGAGAARRARCRCRSRLIGHSDADVGLHALTDALLGTIGAGDIGSHFPPSDPRWAGADSALFLAMPGDLLAAAGGRIEHVDVTLICERPKIGPHRARDGRARRRACSALPPGRVSVKATTTEQLGFTGRGEGIAAQAVATVSLPA